MNTTYEIIYREHEDYLNTADKDSLLEFIYIAQGYGQVHCNNNSNDFSTGDLYIKKPGLMPRFSFETRTEFFRLRFNNIYSQINPLDPESIKRLEYIIEKASSNADSILKNTSDRDLVKPIVNGIVRERVNNDLNAHELIDQLVNTMIIITARNIAMFLPKEPATSDEAKISEIIQYIQDNVSDTEKVKAPYMASHFNISETYLGRYFKKHANETMQQYILHYRLKLVEARLIHSDMKLSEIVSELGFSDESHLNKAFNKYKNINPSEFRKNAKNKTPQLFE